MYYTYNGYTSGTGEAVVTWSKSREVNDQNGYVVYNIYDVTINGVIVNFGGPDAINTAIGNVFTAFSSNGGNFYYYTPTPTAVLSLVNASTVDGVQVVSIDFPDGSAAEWATKRTYSVKLRAKFYDTDFTGKNIVSFTETVSIWGGGARTIWQESVSDDPADFQVAAKTMYYMSQVGTVVGKTSYPSVPAALYPAKLLQPVKIDKTSPEYSKGTYNNYTVSYEYQMGDIAAFGSSTPNTWPE